MAAESVAESASVYPREFFVQPTGERGRPSLDNSADTYRSLSFVLALAVFWEEARLGGKRGDLAKAIRKVSEREKVSEGNVKKYAQRHRLFREVQHGLEALGRDFDEMERRILGLPDDVRAKLSTHAHVGRLLHYLHKHKIDGTAVNAKELIDLVRSTDFLSPK